MLKYVEFTKVETELTVLEFRGQDESVKVNHFDIDVVSLEADTEADIDTLVGSQATEIGCIVIEKAEFKTLVASSAQLNRIRDVVKAKIAEKYDNGDEIAMSKKAVDDTDRVAYETYVSECINFGIGLKAEIGY